MIKEYYHQTKLRTIHTDIKVRNALKIFKNDQWEKLDQKYLKESVGIIRLK